MNTKYENVIFAARLCWLLCPLCPPAKISGRDLCHFYLPPAKLSCRDLWGGQQQTGLSNEMVPAGSQSGFSQSRGMFFSSLWVSTLISRKACCRIVAASPLQVGPIAAALWPHRRRILPASSPHGLPHGRRKWIQSYTIASARHFVAECRRMLAATVAALPPHVARIVAAWAAALPPHMSCELYVCFRSPHPGQLPPDTHHPINVEA